MKWTKRVGFGVVGLLFAAVALVVYEARKPPTGVPGKGDSLTDVAGGGAPRLEGPLAPSAGRGRELLPPPPVVLPSAMPDPAHPPRWTEPLAMPGPPTPPDPFVPPSMSVDPNRGRVADAAP